MGSGSGRQQHRSCTAQHSTVRGNLVSCLGVVSTWQAHVLHYGQHCLSHVLKRAAGSVFTRKLLPVMAPPSKITECVDVCARTCVPGLRHTAARSVHHRLDRVLPPCAQTCGACPAH